MNLLLVKKLAIAFLIGFGGVMVPAVLDLLNDLHNGAPTTFTGAWWISVVAGAFAAGIRAAIAFSPINFIPSDSQHALIKKAPVPAPTPPATTPPPTA